MSLRDIGPPVISGYLTKVGGRVKTWKLRWMVLRKDGRLHYFKKQATVGVDEAQGVLNLTSDCIRLVRWTQVKNENLVKWPQNAEERSGFALGMRNGRMFFMYCESAESCHRWVKAIRSVAANVYMEEGEVEEDKLGEEAIDYSKDVVTGEPGAVADTADTDEGGELDTAGGPAEAAGGESSSGGEVKSYIHKVIGGVVVREEMK